MAWNRGGTRASDESVEAAGLGRGLQEGSGNCRRPGVGGDSEITLGGSWGGMLGWAGSGERVGRKAGGTLRRHDSKISQRFAIASTGEILMGGGDASARAPATT